MLGNILLLVLNAVLGLLALLLVARAYMQWARVSLRNQLGHFVTALTDWLVLPARRLLPPLAGLDLASLVPAWLAESLLVLAEFWLRGFSFGSSAGLAAVLILALGLIETLRLFVFLLIGIVLISAVMSWVNPHSPFAPMFNVLARPFLRPFQRIVPTISNIDLSPLVLLLVLQIALMLLATLRGGIVPMIA
jgi:YggT family protein